MRVSDRLAGFYGLDIKSLLQSELQYAIPYAFRRPDDHLEMAMTSYLQTDRRELVDSGIVFILVDLLLTSDTAVSQNGFEKLRDVYHSEEAPAELLRSHRTKISAQLAMHLGVPHIRAKVTQAKRTWQL